MDIVQGKTERQELLRRNAHKRMHARNGASSVKSSLLVACQGDLDGCSLLRLDSDFTFSPMMIIISCPTMRLETTARGSAFVAGRKL